jgi:uncharacterized protein (DUF983 family)
MTVNHKIALSILAATGVLTLLTLIAAYLMIGIAWQDFQRSAAERAGAELPRSGFTLFKFALARRCPRCGHGAIASSFFVMNEACPSCGITFWKNEGEWVGPAVINYSAALAAVLGTWALTVMYDSSEAVQVTLSSVAAIVAGVGIVPWSRSFWTLFLYLTGEIGPERAT